MNFFKWLRWVFSKQLTIKVENSVFTNVKVTDFYTKNGIFYIYNVRYIVKNCTFDEYKEPEPYNVKVEIDMNMDHGSIFIGGEKMGKSIIIPSDEPLPFEITISKEPVLSDEEKEIVRNNRFVDAIKNWEKRNDRLAEIE